MADEWQAWAEEFQSTLPARGATCEQLLAPALLLISIHAPRTGSDVASSPNTRASYTISIHAPRTGSDRQFSFPCADSVYFNPRSPHGERRLLGQTSGERDISIHAPRTGSDWVEDFFQASNNISIHAPRTGSDDVLQGLIPNGGISIHAPRTGSDMVGMSLGSAVRHFNPRSPHGERRRTGV